MIDNSQEGIFNTFLEVRVLDPLTEVTPSQTNFAEFFQLNLFDGLSVIRVTCNELISLLCLHILAYLLPSLIKAPVLLFIFFVIRALDPNNDSFGMFMTRSVLISCLHVSPPILPIAVVTIIIAVGVRTIAAGAVTAGARRAGTQVTRHVAVVVASRALLGLRPALSGTQLLVGLALLFLLL